MRNLCHFCHYHKGTPKEKIIKILGSFLIILSLSFIGLSSSLAKTADEYIQMSAALLPEPAPATESAPAPAPTQPIPSATASPESQPTTSAPAPTPILPEIKPAQPTQPAPQPGLQPIQSTPINNTETKCPSGEYLGINDRGEKSCIRSDSASNKKEEKYQEPEISDDVREQMDKERVQREKKEVLKQITQQKREVNSLIKKLKRLKGTADDAASAQGVYNKVLEYENKIKSTEDTDDLQANLQEFYEAELWEDINQIRRKVELPNELNNIYKELVKLQKMLKQKSFTKLGFDVGAVQALVAEKLAKHSEAKAAYTQGDFEAAEEIMQEVFRQNHPGNLNGALNMLREIKDQMRQIKDKELKAEIDELLNEVIAGINSGEWEDARRSMEAIRQDLGPLVWKKLMDSEKKRQGVPDEFQNKLDKLREKLGGGTGETPEIPNGQ